MSTNTKNTRSIPSYMKPTLASQAKRVLPGALAASPGSGKRARTTAARRHTPKAVDQTTGNPTAASPQTTEPATPSEV